VAEYGGSIYRPGCTRRRDLFDVAQVLYKEAKHDEVQYIYIPHFLYVRVPIFTPVVSASLLMSGQSNGPLFMRCFFSFLLIMSRLVQHNHWVGMISNIPGFRFVTILTLTSYVEQPRSRNRRYQVL